MPHETTLITTIATAFVSACVLGFLMTKVRLPPLVGYLLAGVLIGPYTPGFVADAQLASQLAEIGVILLMFGVGLHFSIGDLMAVRRIALPGALGQIASATLIGVALAWFWDWPLAAGVVFGLTLSTASTVVLLRALEERNAVHSAEGRIAIGWLIVEDLAMVLALVLLPAFADAPAADAASDLDLLIALLLTLGKVALFVALALIVGRRWVPWLLMHITRADSRELFTLAVLAAALGIAYGSAALFDVSFALGAFFAGVILSESDLSHRAGEDSLPLKDAFAVLFFVSVGMLFDPTILVREPLAVLSVLLVIVVGKSLAAFLIVLAFRYPVRTALTVSASLAQIGEFAFILAGLSVTLGLLPEAGRDFVLAGALLSIALNPLAFAAIPVLERLLGSPAQLPAQMSAPPLSGHAVVVGHGRVGGAVTPLLEREGLPFVVIERDRRLAEPLSARGMHALCADATAPGVLESASIATARLLIVAQPDGFQARRILELARKLNPHIDTVVRTHSDKEVAHLTGEGVGLVVMGELELARRMSEYALRSFGVPPARAELLATGQTEEQLAEKADRM